MRRSLKQQFLKVPSARRLLTVIVGTYLAVVLCVAIFQTRFIYYPSRELDATPASVGLDFDDLMLSAADGVKLSAWFMPHREARGTILFFHGNAGNNGDRIDIFRVLHSMQCNVMIVDYRGYGKSEGRPSEQGTYLDASAAWDYLTVVRNIPDRMIVVLGESLGGAVAVDLALRHPPAALVVQSSFTRLADVAAIHYPYLPVRWLLWHRYDSVDKIGSISCPKLFFHSSEDSLIPIAIGNALFNAASEPKQRIITPGDHNEGGFMYSKAHAAMLKEFLDSIFR